MMSDAKTIALAFLEALSGAEPDTAFAMLAQDARITGPDGKPIERERFEETFRGFGGILASPYQQEILGVTAEGERVAVEARGRAELRNGRIYANIYHFLLEVRGGKVAAMREYCDTQAIAAAFG